EGRAFITATPPHTGKLATVRADGRPHVAPVWYAVDDDGSVVFNTGEKTVKGRNLRRTGYAAMSIDDERPPFSFVVLEGPIELSDDLEQVRRWATVLGGRYMGADTAEACCCPSGRALGGARCCLVGSGGAGSDLRGRGDGAVPRAEAPAGGRVGRRRGRVCGGRRPVRPAARHPRRPGAARGRRAGAR